MTRPKHSSQHQKEDIANDLAENTPACFELAGVLLIQDDNSFQNEDLLLCFALHFPLRDHTLLESVRKLQGQGNWQELCEQNMTWTPSNAMAYSFTK